ncbi:MAG: hypothetical protein RLZZ504_592 [Bacteroidota bacterium]
MVDKRVLNAVRKGLEKLDPSKLIETCTNEAQTRSYLIEPIFETLGYSRQDDMATEMNAGWGKKNDKADIGLYTQGKRVEILVECKKLGVKLNDKHGSQLNSYFGNVKTAKVGILTNGFEWLFFAEDSNTPNVLNPEPFLKLDFSVLTDEFVEAISIFHKSIINIKKIIEDAQDVYFMQRFEKAFIDELIEPSEDWIKSIYARMGGKRLTESIKSEISKRINSHAIQNALPIVIENEMKNGGVVITTGEELAIYNAIKTILIQDKLFKKDHHRITYRDQKNSFNVLLDDNNKKIICKILSNRGKYFVEISGEKFEFSGVENIVALKQRLFDAVNSVIG